METRLEVDVSWAIAWGNAVETICAEGRLNLRATAEANGRMTKCRVGWRTVASRGRNCAEMLHPS